MTTPARILEAFSGGIEALIGGSRPLRRNRNNGVVQIMTERGMVVNSMLREDEWQEVDKAVMQAARYPLRFVNLLRSRGLIKSLTGGLGVLTSAWYAASEMTPATVNLTGRGVVERDLPEMLQFGVPIPIVFKEFNIGKRMLLASRRTGEGIDVTAAGEASRVTAEGIENTFINGADGVTLNGMRLWGVRNHPNRITDTVTNFGGGAWSTITNIVPTVNGMINAAMNTGRHYGPYVLFLSTTQYNLAGNTYYTDGSGQTPLQRLRQLANIEAVEHLPDPVLPAGELLLVQLTADVVDGVEAMELQPLEWMSGDGLEIMFKVMAAIAVRVKARYDGKSGLVHATGS